MSKTVDFRGKPFHFIGIGGIGMSALAYILAKRKLPVSGSDLRVTPITDRLQSAGAHIFSAQEATNLDFFQSISSKSQSSSNALEIEGQSRNSSGCAVVPTDRRDSPQVICSTAIAATNLEYLAALDKGYEIFHRSDVLAGLLGDYSQSIAVAGTHGKTTTSSAIAHLLVQVGLDPTVIVGGEIETLGGNARLGQGGVLVAEADESDGTLTKLVPHIGIVTNIELDHPDHYTSLEQVISTFQTFAQQCKILVGCKDCAVVRDRLNPQITYSLDPNSEADYIATETTYSGQGTRAKIWERGELLGELNLQLLGRHNLSNALAAIAVARLLGLEFDAIATALKSFEGAKRRFEYRGEGGGITFFDDYAHHPSEIQVTLAAARLRVEDPHRVVAVFQPHRYSRVQTFLQEFARSFGDADIAIVTDIYSAGEANPDNLSGQTVADAIAAHHSHVIYQPTFNGLESCLKEILQPGDLALFLGAGNLNQIIPKLVAFYNP
ncbi:UDP-N-acetylmuramate--L-alanine ligase [Oscillatoria sp. FACHB-1406]|uniref:UDP-N-acetylmuramate--L-alanine ligase n=1 Tax=Oscillatoria sp. FACHB-1406 TaxID=2692846 RepID=UPI001682D8BE|nr:UDP-N-acetylmuramate--L-alanine ligase [Oscillatoria sp. FACHB-1406]MBD2576507.1 UDP-N-acetylmuramate--L-alanine ligase [Oscillatoria sp. FACHB-1406]